MLIHSFTEVGDLKVVEMQSPKILLIRNVTLHIVAIATNITQEGKGKQSSTCESISKKDIKS